jgi:plastocyanin
MNSRPAIVIIGVGATLASAIPTSGQENDPNNATHNAHAASNAFVDFGSPQPQPTPAQKSNVLVPNEVTISKGGTVTFRVNGGNHGIAIYPVSKNTSREDVTNQLCIHDAVTGLCVDPTFANDGFWCVPRGHHRSRSRRSSVTVSVRE